MRHFCLNDYSMSNKMFQIQGRQSPKVENGSEGGDIGLFITLVPKVLK